MYCSCLLYSRSIYTARQINLPCSITSCAQPHKEICRFAAVAGAILLADFIGQEYIGKKGRIEGAGRIKE